MFLIFFNINYNIVILISFYFMFLGFYEGNTGIRFFFFFVFLAFFIKFLKLLVFNISFINLRNRK